jgi:hypothetical protein
MTDAPDHELVKVVVPVSADEAWRTLRDPAEIDRWFGWRTESLAEEIHYIFVDHARADEGRRIIAFDGTGDRYEVEPRGEHAVIRVVRAGPAKPGYDEMIEGWIAFTQQLKFALARHPGEVRRTVRLSGSPRDEAGAPAIIALGLTELPAHGELWSQIVGPEPHLSGEVWHFSRHQTGVTVSEWGDGLLIITDRPPGDGWPHGGSTLTLTTYGLDDGAFAALEARWTVWWSEHFGAPSGDEGG